ncbi:MAG: chromosome segregation SMC family protein, partial [bacterium]
MYLSRLDVLGFKSFARKTNIDFHDGITAIVGPNGCGKSNVVDAIRWVLGEQRAGLLRSDNMQNVIFNGTRTQKPLGMAEVSLTIQNSRSVLPIEFNEVVITRRLFRSGESQYLLNQSPCRLKDIVDLFMDTGMGSNAYSVIELGMVEKILNGKPEERRQIFEEAAGVTKYKIRRRAAFRKLEATEQDLIRLSDIISEVEKTTNSLRRQVNKATRYRDMSRELRQLELDYSAYNHAKIQQELTPLEAKSKETIDQKEQISSELATKEAAVEKKQVELLEHERQLNARGTNLSANRQRIREKEEEILICKERIEALKTARERANSEIDELTQRATEIVEEKSTETEKLQQAQAQLLQSESALQDARAELGDVETIYADKRAAGKDLESLRLSLIEEIATKQKNEERLRTHLAFSDDRAKTIEDERTKLDLQIQELTEKEKELSAQKQNYRDRAEELEDELVTTSRDLELARENIEKCKAEIMQLQGKMKARQDRAGLLRKVLESYEDYPEGVRYLLREEEQVAGYHGTLGDLLSVDDKYRRAIEVALGD